MKPINPFLQQTVFIYLSIVLLIASFTSIVVLPGNSFAVPSYLLIYLFFPLMAGYDLVKNKQLIRELFIIGSVFVFINLISQLNDYYTGIYLSPQLKLVEKGTLEKVLLRKTMFTQTLYLFAGILFYLYLKYFAEQKHIRYLFIGLEILAAYGLLEILLYQFTGHNGDFISNRKFINNNKIASGSLFQTITISGHPFQRLKSLTGEPSMYAFTIVPFLILAVAFKRKLAIALFALTLALSGSTSAIIGLAILICALFFIYPQWRKKAGLIVGSVVLIVIALYFASSNIHTFIKAVLLDKVTGGNESSVVRSKYFADQMGYWWNDLNFTGKLFGIGFGYVRSGDFLSTLLVNNGIIGFLLFTYFYFKHAFVALHPKQLHWFYITALIATYIIMMVAVPEFAYLSLWVLLAFPYFYKRVGNTALHTHS